MTISNLNVFDPAGNTQTFIPGIVAGGVYRIKTDPEILDWAGISWLDGQYHDLQSRTANRNWSDTHLIKGKRMLQAPQTARVQLSNGKSQFGLTPHWIDEITRRNPTTIKYMSRGGSGIVNKDTWPTFQALLFRNNKIVVESVDDHKAWLKHFDLLRPPPVVQDDILWHAFTVIDQNGVTLFPDPPGTICWLPVIAPCRLWIDVRELVCV